MAAELQAHVQWVSGTTSLASSGTHSVTIDRPAAKGGSDLGFAGGELFVVGLGGCYMSNLLAAAQGRNIQINAARLNARGVLGEAPVRIVEFILEVELDADCNAGCCPSKPGKVVLAYHRRIKPKEMMPDGYSTTMV